MAAATQVLPVVHPLVPAVEKEPDQHAGACDQGEHRPGLGMAVGRRVVVADHDEHDRQREIVVVDAALLAARAVDRVRPKARPHRGDHPLPAPG